MAKGIPKLLSLLLILVPILIGAEDPLRGGEPVDIWPVDRVPSGKQHSPQNERGKWVESDGAYHSIHVPSITYFKYKTLTELSSCVIILFPGGAYKKLAYQKEGLKIAEFLNRVGLHVFILRYRHDPYLHPVPLIDGLQAVRFVRSHAALYGFSKHLVGVMGLSAGGHLAAMVATLFNDPIGKVPIISDTFREIQEASGRPNYVVLLHPVVAMNTAPYGHEQMKKTLLGANYSSDSLDQISPHLNVQKDTPPMFILHTGEDAQVPPENSLLLYQALHAQGIHAELHIYAEGQHGLDMTNHTSLPVNMEWPGSFTKWLLRLQL